MSATTSSPSASHPADERRPLLESRTACVQANVQSDLEAAVPADKLEEIQAVVKTASLWTILWYLVIAILGGTLFSGVIKAFVEKFGIQLDLKQVLLCALCSGFSGATAMAMQVLTFMPVRNTVNYKLRHGITTIEAVRKLYADGGFPRYYQGLFAALAQEPVARFSDTATNAGILALLDSSTFTKELPSGIKTMFPSLFSAGFKMILTPIGTTKTALQTELKDDLASLRKEIDKYRTTITTFCFGALETAASSLIVQYPWFATYNYLQELLPEQENIWMELLRQALIGFCATLASDTISNPLHVVETYREVHGSEVGYLTAAKSVVDTDGVLGLLCGGLKTRIVANGPQGIMFTVLWKLLMDLSFAFKF